MMNKLGGSKSAASAVALLLALVPAALPAQTPDFSIPTARPSSANPRAQGPVDDENPVVRVRPTPSPTPAPVITPAPVATESVRPAATPASRPAAGLPARTAPQPSRTTPVPASTATAAPAIAAPSSAPSPVPSTDAPIPVPTVTATDSFALPPAEPATSAAPGWYWPWVAGGAALLATIFALLWWRRRPKTPLLEFEPPVASEPAPQPLAAASPSPAAEPQPVPQPAVAAAANGVSESGVAISLEAQRMSASLMATTLNYTLRLTNTSSEPLSALAVEGDMIAAHASIPPEQQIANDNQRLELRHALVTLAPGESAEFTGDFRLPLTSIVPIRAGAAAYFVPLARLRVEASRQSGGQLVEVQTFVVGELPEQPGAALRPFRLDLGPRTYSRVGQRAVS